MKGKFNFAEVAIAIMGLWFIVSPLPDFLAGTFAYVMTGFVNTNDELWLGSLAFTIIKIGLGLILVGYRVKIANIVELNQESPIQINSVVSAALLILGVYFLLQGIVSLGQHVALLDKPNISNPYLYWQGIFSIVSGGLLSLTSVFISRIWWKFQREET